MIYNNTSLREIKDQLENLIGNSNQKIIIGGHLNARIAALAATNPSHERQAKDTIVDEEGEKWVEFFHTNDMTLLNGNVSGDWN